VPRITAIKPQKNQKRLNVYLDQEFGFGIDLENFTKLGLRVEQDLSDSQVEEIVKKAEFQKTLDKLLNFATLRPRSNKEIKDWLKRKKIHQSLNIELFNRLNRLDLVNDRAFALWWINQRQEFKPRGKKILSYELKLKGIDKEIIDEVLEDTPIDEKKIAWELLEKKSYRWKSLDKKIAKQKMYQFLARKGFDWTIIEKVVEKMIKLPSE